MITAAFPSKAELIITIVLEPSLYRQLSSSMFNHMGDKSEHTGRLPYTSYHNRFPRFSGSAPFLHQRSDYLYLSQDIQKLNYSSPIFEYLHFF
jgi:hypothetical protein